MKFRLLYILLIVAVCVSSCKKKEHVIPRGKMSKIYAEMFVTDQKLIGQPGSIRAVIDTSWVYEPIFEKYGYTSDDYRASVAYYIQDATRFARIVRKSTLIIEAEIKDLQKQKALMEKMEGVEKISYEPERIFYLTGINNPNLFGNDTLRFYVDCTGGQQWFDPRDWADTAYYGPVIRVFENEIITTEEAEEDGGASGYESSEGDGGDTSEKEVVKVSGNVVDSLKVGSDSTSVIEGTSDSVTVKSAVADTLLRKRRVGKGRAGETEAADEIKSDKVSRDRNRKNE